MSEEHVSGTEIANRHRLDRIEAKIDRLAETVIQIARAEEKLVNLEQKTNILLSRMIAAENRLQEHAKEMTEQRSTLHVMNRVFWIILTFGIMSTLGAIATTIIKTQ